MTSLCAASGKPSGFLDSPQRLEPPCMLGMLRTAMPSSEMPLRSSCLPQHWWRHNNRLISLYVTKARIWTLADHWYRWNNRMTVGEIFTSIERQSLSLLQEAEMVSEVANSKYQSLFFILKRKRENKNNFTVPDLKNNNNLISVTLFRKTLTQVM